MSTEIMDKVVALAKRRGFIFQEAEIYGGLANTWTYGPKGSELLRNIRNLWWKKFVTQRQEIFGIEAPVITTPKVWNASGHIESLVDAMVECKSCHQRTRADHLIEDNVEDIQVEGLPTTELDNIITSNKLHCPNCGEFDWTETRNFNLLFETKIGIVSESESLAYLRGETAQGMFVNFKQILDSNHPKLPFGIAQIGKVFRNEITKGHFIFRTLEFEQMEIEYFVQPQEWEKQFESWKEQMWEWLIDLGINEEKLRWRSHTEEELSHYSSRTEDIEYEFPFGFKELYGLAYRSDFDLKNHSEHSGHDLKYHDLQSNEKFYPHVIEPTFGLNRTMLTIMVDAYREENDRVWLSLSPKVAPHTIAIFPLLRNKPELIQKAKEVMDLLSPHFSTVWDDRGNIGKRYYAQDEIGTPWCVTVDFDSIEKNTVTIRDRDTTEQITLGIDELITHFNTQLSR